MLSISNMNLQKYKQCVDELKPEQLHYFKEIVGGVSDIIILGNGGSNAIASHIAQDYTKILRKRALCFSDSSRLSCYANDFGWDLAYVNFIEDFATPLTLVILISSAGNSSNILNAATYCKQIGNPIVTLSGFSNTNRLLTEHGEYSLTNFWVDSNDYGIVECTHQLILHSIL